MTEVFVGVVVGLVTGATSSFVMWWLVSHGIRSHVVISDKIAQAGPRDYRIKCCNRGRRGATHVSLRTYIMFNGVEGAPFGFLLRQTEIGLLQDRSEEPMLTEWWSRVRPGGVEQDTFSACRQFMPSSVGDAIAAGNPFDLAHLFDHNPGGIFVRADLEATDSFSQTPTLVTRHFGRDDLEPGEFRPDSLDVHLDVEGWNKSPSRCYGA